MDLTLKMDNGTVVDASNLMTPVEIRLPVGQRSADAAELLKPSFARIGEMKYRTFSIPSDDVPVLLTIMPDGNRSVIVYVSPKARPTPTSFNVTTSLPNKTLCKTNSVALNCGREAYTFPVSSSMTGASGLHYVGVKLLDSDVRSDEKQNQRSRRDCEGHNGRRKRSCIGVKDPPTTVPPTTKILIRPTYNAATDGNYTFSVNVPSCQYWSNEDERWTEEGCRVRCCRKRIFVLECSKEPFYEDILSLSS